MLGADNKICYRQKHQICWGNKQLQIMKYFRKIILYVEKKQLQIIKSVRYEQLQIILIILLQIILQKPIGIKENNIILTNPFVLLATHFIRPLFCMHYQAILFFVKIFSYKHFSSLKLT